MRTTLDVELDVLDAARALAAARGVSVGAALSELARRGISARTPMASRNGFPVFQIGADTPAFGPEQVLAGLQDEEIGSVRQFVAPLDRK